MAKDRIISALFSQPCSFTVIHLTMDNNLRAGVCVSYLAVTSSVNIRMRCVMERRVAMTMCDPTTELIFRHAGSVELVTR